MNVYIVGAVIAILQIVVLVVLQKAVKNQGGKTEDLLSPLRAEFAANRQEYANQAAQGRAELAGAVKELTESLLNRLSDNLNTQKNQFEMFASQLKDLSLQLQQRLQEAAERQTQQAKQATEQQDKALKQVATTLAERLGDFSASQQKSFSDFSELQQQLGKAGQESQQQLQQQLQQRLQESAQQAKDLALKQQQDLDGWFRSFKDATSEQLQNAQKAQQQGLEQVTMRLEKLTAANNEALDKIRTELSQQLQTLQKDNGEKLEKMREVVDEKLQSTLEKRLGESFKLVSERLEKVHAGLGEMQKLAAGVGDLKKVLTNVKTRGVVGEIFLGNLLEQLLTADQYSQNVKTRPSSDALVEFAVRLPGKESDEPVWLPIDAKFPVEDYQRLQDAFETGNADDMQVWHKAVVNRIKESAKTIRQKYVEPPYTTDFAILYLPIEGLFAEVLREPGLLENIQRDFKILITGPTTLAAILNSLQMGFKTLAIEKRSSEVWNVLAAVKTEFGKFGDILAKTGKNLERTLSSISQAEVRTRAISRRLRSVQELPEQEAIEVLGDDSLLLPGFEEEE